MPTIAAAARKSTIARMDRPACMLLMVIIQLIYNKDGQLTLTTTRGHDRICPYAGRRPGQRRIAQPARVQRSVNATVPWRNPREAQATTSGARVSAC